MFGQVWVVIFSLCNCSVILGCPQRYNMWKIVICNVCVDDWINSLVDYRAYKPYTPVGPPALRLVLAPIAVYSSTTDYIFTKYTSLTKFLRVLSGNENSKFSQHYLLHDSNLKHYCQNYVTFSRFCSNIDSKSSN